MVTNPIFALFFERVYTTLVVDLELGPFYDQDVHVEGEGGVGGVKLFLVALRVHDALKVGQVGHTGKLVPGKHRAIDAVLGNDVPASGVNCDVGAGGDKDVGVGVVCVPHGLCHVKILPIPDIQFQGDQNI